MRKHTAWDEQIRDGLVPLQNRDVPRYRATEHFRWYSSTLVPGLLQTEQYAAAVLRTAARFHETPVSDSADAARARVARSGVLHDPGHRFDFVVEESVLRSQIADPDVMSAQLGQLITVDALPDVSFGVIPSAVYERVQWTHETFHIFDETVVNVELVSAEVEIINPAEIALYLKAFEELRSMAVYGTEARALIVNAIESLR